MNFSFHEARDIAEGLIEYDDVRVIVAAWQFLIDGGHIRRLDDWFKSSATELIQLGICWPRANSGYYNKRVDNRHGP